MATLIGAGAVGLTVLGVLGLTRRKNKSQAIRVSSTQGYDNGMQHLPSLADTTVIDPIQPAQMAPGGDLPFSSKRKGASVYTPGLVDRTGSDMYRNPTMYETSTNEYQDQDDWQLDCGGVIGGYDPEKCPRYDAHSSGHLPPLRGQHLAESVGQIGDYVHEQIETRRDAEIEINEDPCPTRTYPDYALGHGEPLESSYIPHGNHAQTDLEFWGPTNWDSYRFHKIPSYLFQGAQELNGKEINRPFDDFTMHFDGSGEYDEQEVQWGSGAVSSRTPDVRLLGANQSQTFATTTRPWEEKKRLPPTANRGGFGAPPVESLIYFGGRSEPVYNAFSGVRDMGGRSAPSDAAEIQLPAHTRNPQMYEAYHGGAVGATQTYGGEDVNLVQGGRINRRIDYTPPLLLGSVGPGGEAPAGVDLHPQMESRVRRVGTRFDLGRAESSAYGYGGAGDDSTPGIWDTKGAPSFTVGANAGLDINPADGGYMHRTRVRERPFSESNMGMGMHGGSGPIRLENMMSGARMPKGDGVRKVFRTVGGGVSNYTGSADPISFKKSISFLLPSAGGASGGGGSGGLTAPRGVFTIHGNSVLGTRGATYSEEPEEDDVGDARNGSLYKNIVGKRSEAELDDLFSVEHS